MIASSSVSVLSIESLGVKLYNVGNREALHLCFSTLHRVVGGETLIMLSLLYFLRNVSVLSIESLGVKQMKEEQKS